MAIHQIKSYFSYLVSSTNKYGVHSPFMYELITKCFELPENQIQKEINLVKQYRNNLKQSNAKILVTDFGAGSKVFKSKNRAVSKIAQYAGISQKKSKLLLKLIKYFKPQTILEIGTSLGIGTACIGFVGSKSKIITLEGCPETAKIAQSQFDKFNLLNIKIVMGDFKYTLQKVVDDNTFDLIYFDGNHKKDATISYFLQCLPSIKNNSVFIFDDIHWSKDMEQAWNFIKNHEKVTVSIDLYDWGMIFFRKEQRKEHFILRV